MTKDDPFGKRTGSIRVTGSAWKMDVIDTPCEKSTVSACAAAAEQGLIVRAHPVPQLRREVRQIAAFPAAQEQSDGSQDPGSQDDIGGPHNASPRRGSGRGGGRPPRSGRSRDRYP